MRLKVSSAVLRTSLGFMGCVPLLLAQGLPVPDRGTIVLTLPPAWKETQRKTPTNLPPTFTFERAGSPRGSLLVTLSWSPDAEADFTAPERIRAFCVAGQRAFKDETVEQDFPLKPLTGTQGVGFFYDATDKNYKSPQGNPVPGEFPVLTHGELGMGSLLVSFTVMTDAKGDASVLEALNAIQKATLQRAVPASQRTKVKGAGLELTLDLEGFTQRMGEKHFRGSYYQIGFYASDAKKLNVSILVDDLHGMTLADLEKAGIAQSKGAAKLLAGANVVSEPVEHPKGWLISFPSELAPGQYKNYILQHWYFETIFQGRWLEFHVSKVFKLGEDVRAARAEVLKIVQSLQPQ